MHHLVTLPAFAAGLLACGSLGGDGGGADNLPNRGIVPWEPVVAGSGDDASRALLRAEAGSVDRLVGPAVLRDGRAWVMFVERGGPGRPGRLLRVELTDAFVFSQPVDAVAAEVAGTLVAGAQGVRAPSVTERGDGFVLGFEVGDGQGIATQPLDARGRLTGSPSLLLVPEGSGEAQGVRAPSLVDDGGELLVFYASGEAGGASTLRRARVAADGTVSDRRVVLRSEPECPDAAGKPETCWDAEGLSDPDVRIATTALGERTWRLFYAAGAPDRRDIGFAASDDGLRWFRFPYNPVLSERSLDEAGPFQAFEGGRYWLFHSIGSPSKPSGIGIAVNAPDAPSETF
jgi:hypothetical protein